MVDEVTSDADRILHGACRAYRVRSLDTAPSSAPRHQAIAGARSWSVTEKDRDLVAQIQQARAMRK